MQGYVCPDLYRTFNMSGVNYPSPRPNRPVSISRQALLIRANEMKTVYNFTFTGLLDGVCWLGPASASPGQIGVT
jgi:hypothetical protein